MGLSPRTLRPANNFTPKSISGLALWLDASDSSTLFQSSDGTVPATATSDPVGYWGDKSGNGRHATQSTAGNRPTISATAVQNRKALGFNGTSGRLALPSMDSTPSTVLAVARHNSGTSSAGRTPLCIMDGGSYMSWQFQQTGTIRAGVTYNASQSHFTAGGIDPQGTVLLLTGQMSSGGGGLLGRLNGAGLPFADTIAYADGGQSRIGCRYRNADDQFWSGEICEVLHYQSALSGSQVQRLERYLAAKWGITLAPQVSNADAQDWVNRVYANGGTVSASTAAAVNEFCNSVDSNGLRSKMVRVNLMCGSNLNAALVPLYRATSFGGSPLGETTDLNSNFLDAHYAENSGLVGNASNRRLNTGLNRSALGVTVHAGCFAFSRGTASYRTYFGVEKQATAFDRFYMACAADPTNLAWASNGTSATGQTADTAHAAKDFLLGSVVGVGAGQNTLYINGTSVATASGVDSTSIVSPIHIFTFFRASDSSYNSYTDARIGGYTFGSSLSAGEALTYSTIWDTFLKAVGRR